MQWTPDLATGNAVVDGEHKQLIALINELELAGSGPDGSAVPDALDELTDYVFVHFQMEEKLMRREAIRRPRTRPTSPSIASSTRQHRSWPSSTRRAR